MRIRREWKRHWPYYVMILPGVIWLIIFKYIPLMGSVIAFQNYSIFDGILGSEWVGLAQFKKLFQYPDFYRILRNTLVFGGIQILIFPVSIILALMLNEIGHKILKKSIQTAIYIPHFLSWVVVGGLVFDFFGLNGIFNTIRNMLGMESILVMQKESWYRGVYIFSKIWKESGWGTVVYLAAISGIDPTLYESATMDGAGRLQKMKYITIPMIIPTAMTLFLLRIGNFLELGFDAAHNLMTPMTYSVADIFDTYVYRQGILNAQYSFSTAVGVFQSVVGFLLLVTFNKLSKKYSEEGGLW